ncbi:MAG: hypothetical protein K9L77_01785 [Candidatus Omnitrophica bacterium]|nr:hypothetical protein [Candidatus Omnitrophota bacterium]
MFEKVNKAIDFFRWPAFFILFSYLVLFASFNLHGLDYLFHIKSGEYILETGQVPREDVFSFTQEGKEWDNHEWLYQVLIYKIYQQFGIEGLILFKAIILIIAFFLLTAIALKIDWIFAFFLIFFSLKVSFARFTLRPDHLSFLFFILFLIPFVFKKKKLLYSLPFIQVIWVNTHGFFFLGPLVLLLYLFSGWLGKKNHNQFYKKAKIITLFTIFACLINPYPITTLIYPLKIIKDILGGRQTIFYQSIQELRSPLTPFSLNSLYIKYFIFTSFFAFIFIRPNFFYLFLWAVMALFSLNSMRNFYFYIPAAIALVQNRFFYIKRYFLREVVTVKGFFLIRILLFIFIAQISLTTAGQIINAPKTKYSYLDFSLENSVESSSKFFRQRETEYPKKLINFIKNNQLPDNMYNNFNLGSNLIFNFYPKRKVFIDGRAEFYGQDFFRFYNNINSGNKAALDEAVERYKLKGFIIGYKRDNPPELIFTLYKKGYRCIYFGMDGIIFIKESVLKDYPNLRKKKIDFSQYQPESLDFIKDVKLYTPYAEGLYKKGYVLYRLGFYNKSRIHMSNLLNIYPGGYKALYILAKIKYKNKNYEQAYIFARKALGFNSNFKKAKKFIARIYLDLGKEKPARELLDELNLNLEKFKTEKVK